ncbi:hypothetical protein [Amycolatopsis anabasis]|uniref:hypothetical protein n=1 Tax=Amycolatopsis anabasis TaxID=1840409 RepID=UPI00131AE04C|nr:hypothetical protein [Amycolatopsis anabasis]
MTAAWRAPGLHWHAQVCRGDAKVAAPEAVLYTPYAVAAWTAHRIRRSAGQLSVWAADENRWRGIGDPADTARIRLELLLIAARGESVHLSVTSPAQHYLIQAVTSRECAEHGVFPESLAEHCRNPCDDYLSVAWDAL